MNCENIKLAVHDYCQSGLTDLDNELMSGATDAINQHLSHCDSCRLLYEQHKKLTSQLRSIPRPSTSNTLKQRILTDRAAQQDKDRKQKIAYIGIAASVCLTVIITLLINTNQQSSMAEKVAITAKQATQSSILAIKNKPSQVNFLVNSEQIIDDVTFTISVPPQMVLYGYTGQKTLSWHGKLKRGKNLLTVPVMALSEQTGILVMKISHKNAVKEYRVAVNVRQDRVMSPIRTSGRLS